MEHTTFAKKTVVLAALGALSLMAATVRAEDETEIKPTPLSQNIIVTIGGDKEQDIASTIKEESDVTWDQTWLDEHKEDGTTFGGVTVVKEENGPDTITVTDKGSLTINLPTSEADGKFVTFKDTGLTVGKGGVFSNSSYVKFDQGSLTVTDADFTNGEKGVIELTGEDAEFNLSASTAEAAGNFENAGRIVLGDKATMTVGSGDDPITSSDDELALNVGNVTIGKDATLINKDKGYQVDKGTKDQADGDVAGEEEAAPTQALVQFGTVTADGGQFVNAEGALSKGTALVIESVATGTKAVEINGTSVWGALRLAKVTGEQNRESFVQVNQDAKFQVTNSLVIGEFAEGGVFTIDADKDAEVFADGVDISAGSHIATTALEQKNPGEGLTWNEGKPAVGTLKLTGFAATFEEATETPEEGAKAEAGEGETTTNGSWTYKKFGDVSAINTALVIEGNRAKADDLQKSYSPSLHMSSLTLGGTTMKIAYDAEVDAIKKAVETAWDKVKDKDADLIDMEGWSKDNILEKLESLLGEEEYAKLKEELDAQRKKLESGDESLEGENGLAGVLASFSSAVESKINGSDLSIGTLTLAVKNETVKVELSASDSEDAGNGEGATTQADEETGTDTKSETVTVTGNETYGFKDLSLKVTNSNLDVDTLDLQTGSITLTGSNMMVGNVETLNGNLTLSDGYLGLNVTTGVTNDIVKTIGTTVEVGSPVAIGENGKFTIGGEAFTYQPADDKEAVDYAVGIAGNADIVFDGRNFNSEALFSQDRTDGNKGIVAVNGTGTKLTVKATNLSWGVYKLFDEDTLDTTSLTGGEDGNVQVEISDKTVNGLWKDAVGNKISADGNEIVVGGKTIEGSSLDIGAVNLANSVVGGDRGSALDKVLFNHILSNGKSLDEISNTINSITAMGAVAGLTAMTVDFGAYVTDQVEHHAVTIPHQQEGWWVQGLAGKLKSDDLAVGGMKGGYSIDTVGIMGGFDKKLRNGDTIGVAASYQSGDADSEGEGLPVTTDVTNYGLHLWHARQFDAYRLMGMFSYSKTSGDAKMNYAGNELTSDLGATEISIGARADKEFQWGTVRMIPHAGVRASMIDVDDYTIEMGSEELFKVSEDKLWIFEVPVGVTFASSFEYARWNVQPYVDLTVRGRFGDTDSTFTLEGSNTSDSMKYDVTGDVIGDLRIGYMSTFQDLNLGMSYGLSAGDGGRQNHQLEATLRIDF